MIGDWIQPLSNIGGTFLKRHTRGENKRPCCLGALTGLPCFGFQSNIFVASTNKRQCQKYAAYIGPGAIVYRLGFESGNADIDGVMAFSEKELAHHTASVVAFVRHTYSLFAQSSADTHDIYRGIENFKCITLIHAMLQERKSVLRGVQKSMELLKGHSDF